MDYDLLRFSLKFINNKFRQQSSVQQDHEMAPDKKVPLLHHHVGWNNVYKTYDYFIATNLVLFEKHSYKNEIPKSIQESPEETKNQLETLLKIAKENIDLFNKLHPIVFNETGFTDFYECIPVTHGQKYLIIEDNKEEWEIKSKRFNELASYVRKFYSIQDFFYYSFDFYYFVNELIGDWIEDKNRKKQKEELEIKNLKREKWKFWMGYILGFISSAILLILAHFLNPSH